MEVKKIEHKHQYFPTEKMQSYNKIAVKKGATWQSKTWELGQTTW